MKLQLQIKHKKSLKNFKKVLTLNSKHDIMYTVERHRKQFEKEIKNFKKIEKMC